MVSNDKISFHDAGINAAVQTGNSICLSLESVDVNGELKNVNIFIEGVTKIICEGKPLVAFRMEADEGEVLTLKSTPSLVELIMIWNVYKNHKNTTMYYKFICES